MLHPNTGQRRHPRVEKQNALMEGEARIRDETERLSAYATSYGLCTRLDHSVGQILDALEASGFADRTTVDYISNHADYLGARSL